MEIIGAIIVGLIAGVLARFLLPGRDDMAMLGTLALGLAGSAAGGVLVNAVFGGPAVSIVGSTVGVIVVLLAYRAITARKGKAAT